MRFALPAGVIVGVGVVASYLFALNDLGYTVIQAGVIVTTVLVISGLYLVYGIEGGSLRRRTAVGGMCVVLLGLYVAAILLPVTRGFCAVTVPDPGWWSPLIGAAIAILALYLAGFPSQDNGRSPDPPTAEQDGAIHADQRRSDAASPGESPRTQRGRLHVLPRLLPPAPAGSRGRR